MSKTVQRRERGGVTRRRFVAMATGAGAALAAPAIAQGRARVVIVGGGPAGVTTAKYLKQSAPGVEVTLVHAHERYTTCFFSNMYLAGYWSLRALTYGYGHIGGRHGVRMVRDSAVGVDLLSRQLFLYASGSLPYDRLVLAPGISLRVDEVAGYDVAAREIMPHSYFAGYQTYLLHQRIRAMREGGTFVLSVPQGPYRAGTAPYERASMIAHLFTRINPRAKIVIVDSKDKFGLQDQFQAKWRALYGDMIEWASAESTAGGIASVNAQTMEVFTKDGGRLSADAACIIPPQRAADIVASAGLTAEDGWAPVDAYDMRSLIDPNVYILGDSANAAPMPKSAFSAHSHAHRCAAAIRAELGLVELMPARYRAIAWAYVAPTQALKSGATFSGAERRFDRLSGFASDGEETPEALKKSALEGISWYAGVTADMFS